MTRVETLPAWRDEYLTRVRGIISTYGWMLQAIPDGTATFVYTVGMTARRLPELVIVGLPYDVAGDALNRAATTHTTTQIRPGQGPVDAGLPVQLRPTPLRLDLVCGNLGTARALYGNKVTALQLWWPDDAGRYPNDPGYTAGGLQTLARAR